MDLLISGITIFVLALFVGFEIITKIPPTLHTPLMSGSNAISGITLVGAILSAGSQQVLVTTILG
ncbi:MAG: proton-translocating transhydrogenase family protein, partial [Nitrospirales bacterium]